eukprot:40042-Prorocentrum_minimum.AAC.1
MATRFIYGFQNSFKVPQTPLPSRVSFVRPATRRPPHPYMTSKQINEYQQSIKRVRPEQASPLDIGLSSTLESIFQGLEPIMGD